MNIVPFVTNNEIIKDGVLHINNRTYIWDRYHELFNIIHEYGHANSSNFEIHFDPYKNTSYLYLYNLFMLWEMILYFIIIKKCIKSKIPIHYYIIIILSTCCVIFLTTIRYMGLSSY